MGFLSASLLWAGVFAAHESGLFLAHDAADDEALAASEPSAEDASGETPKGRGKDRRRRRTDRRLARADDGASATTGDDLGWDDPRGLDMEGGEQQLTGAQIEAGFDSMLGRIRRCLVLVPSDGEVSGRLTFGMRVGADGRPKAVNLSGPSIVTRGESGDCLRSAAQSIRFASFDGPDMLFKYPIDLQ